MSSRSRDAASQKRTGTSQRQRKSGARESSDSPTERYAPAASRGAGHAAPMMSRNARHSAVRRAQRAPSQSLRETTTIGMVRSLLENAVSVRSAEVRQHCTAAVEEHVRRLLQENEDYACELDDQQEVIDEMDVLEDELDKARASEREAISNLSQVQDENTALQRTIAEVTERSRWSTSREVQKLQKEISQLKEGLRDAAGTIQEKDGAIAQVKEELRSTQHSLELGEEERERLREDLDNEREGKMSAQKVLLTVNERNFELMNKLSAMEETRVRLEGKLSENATASASLIDAAEVRGAEKMHETLATLRAQLRAAESARDTTKEELNRLEAKLESWTASRREDERRVSEMERQNWSSKSDIEKLEEALRLSRAEVSRREDKQKRLKDEISRLRDSVNTLQSERGGAVTRSEALAGENAALSKELSNLRVELSQTQVQLNAMSDKHQQLMRALEDEERCHATTRQEVDRVQSEASRQAADARDQHEHINQQMINVRTELRELEVVRGELVAMEQEKRTLADTVSRQHESMTALSRDANVAHEQSEKERELRRKLQASLEIKDGQVASLMEMNTRLSAELRARSSDSVADVLHGYGVNGGVGGAIVGDVEGAMGSASSPHVHSLHSSTSHNAHSNLETHSPPSPRHFSPRPQHGHSPSQSSPYHPILRSSDSRSLARHSDDRRGLERDRMARSAGRDQLMGEIEGLIDTLRARGV